VGAHFPPVHARTAVGMPPSSAEQRHDDSSGGQSLTDNNEIDNEMDTLSTRPDRIELLATVAHELRNPLAAIQCAVRVLGAPNQTHSTLEQARAVIGRQVVRIARISDDLLNASYVATGKLTLRKEDIDLRDIVRAAVETCRPQLDAGHHTLILRLPTEPVDMDADPARLTQVLTNLLDNAAKFSERLGKIVIGVECTKSEVSIRVVDRGIGIAPEFLPRVFDLFVQADQTQARSNAGMGIGLNLVKRIVELHGGTVEVMSAGLGSGSTFTLRLPRHV
jgi:signal transduction histidine kinase